MIDQVNAFRDSRNILHLTLAEAENAERGYKLNDLHRLAQEVVDLASDLTNPDIDKRGFDLTYLQGLNHGTLQPLADYLQLLVANSINREKQFGEVRMSSIGK